MKAITRLFSRKPEEPVEPQAEPGTELEPEPQEPAGPPVRVLVVDDDEGVLDLMQVTLTRAGFEVAGLASDASTALELAEREQPDLILLDLHMPDRSGLELLPELRALCPGTKIVVFSAIAATYMTEEALAGGAIAFIIKGVSPRSIVEHLHKVLHSGTLAAVLPYPLNREYPKPDPQP